MGIQGLLSFVKEAHEERIDIAEYKDRDVGIDISTWIFRGLQHFLCPSRIDTPGLTLAVFERPCESSVLPFH